MPQFLGKEVKKGDLVMIVTKRGRFHALPVLGYVLEIEDRRDGHERPQQLIRLKDPLKFGKPIEREGQLFDYIERTTIRDWYTTNQIEKIYVETREITRYLESLGEEYSIYTKKFKKMKEK